MPDKTAGHAADAPSHRIRWIDVSKGIAMLLVFYGHIHEEGTLPWLPDLVFSNDTVYFFHMPLFFILSGITFHPSASFIQFAGKRFRRLVIPYYFFSLYVLSKVVLKVASPALFSSLFSRETWMAPEELASILMGNSPGLWFFWALFWGDLMLWVLSRCPKPLRALIALVCLLAWPLIPSVNWPFCLASAFQALAFTSLGWILSDWLKRLGRGPSALTAVISIGTFVTSVQIFLRLPSSPAAHYGTTLTAAISGSLMVIGLVKAIFPTCTPIEYIGRNTMVYYGLNGLSLACAKRLLLLVIPLPSIQSTVCSQLLVALLAILAACLICAAVTPLLYRFCWWGVGKDKEPANAAGHL
ncbi:hypothetical protein CRD60_07455 [Bifidobacterium aemilianum]|uniref:Acyltransferase 3 domain-containing protein n=1 Tax=Bifidobacterium aemilianum TaxID=2493120 RepID=A0A366K6D7_9BIFI|nr:acyltransferase family protein [Bifidobacterium aemilianum]RBP97306.1 hypothetical protein CRD60_07455 [Bifidobacterium aemilianum]